MQQAAAFAERNDLGVWSLCGGFQIPLQSDAVTLPAEIPTDPAPSIPDEPDPAPQPGGGCDPNYSGCVPLVSYDLNCPDIGFMVQVIGSDPHGFDRDNDGYGCESYG